MRKPPAVKLAGLLMLLAAPAFAQNWLDTRIELEALAATGDYTAAATLGETYVAQIRETFGEGSDQLAEAHLLLATMQAGSGAPLDAESSALIAIEIYESNGGPQSTRLIDPLLALGNTYHATGEFELALGTFEEARNIGRRAYGLLNEGQIGILDRMSNSALALHGFDEAKKLQLEAVDLIERIYGEASIEFLDAHYRYAEWLRSRREFVEAERTYYSVQRMIRRDFDDDPVQRIRLLLIRAQNQREFNTTWGYRGQAGMAPGLSGSQPEDLEQALEIARELDEPDPVLEARILRDTGDWYVAQMDFDRIAEPYEQAWQLLDDVEGGAGLQLEWFAEQTMLYAAPMYSPYVVVDPAAPSGRVEIEFTIDAHGLTRNVEIVEVEPQGLLEEAAIRQIGSSRFRPRIEDGAVVSSTGSFTWVFQYDAERARRFGSSFSLNN